MKIMLKSRTGYPGGLGLGGPGGAGGAGGGGGGSVVVEAEAELADLNEH